MPEDEPAGAEPAPGSEPAEHAADELAPEPAVGAKLRRVPHFERGLALETRREPFSGRSRSGLAGRRSGFGRAPWLKRLRPWAGLMLLAGCLYGLLSGSQWFLLRSSVQRAAVYGGVVVVIDPGHGGMDSGAVAQGVVEKDLNLDVGLRVARVLAAAGLSVKLTRNDDHYVPLESRVEIANALPGAIFVSIHFNDAQGEGRATYRASGIETYYSGVKQLAPAPTAIWTTLFHAGKPAANLAPAEAVRAGALLADSIQQSLIAHTAATDRGIKEAGLYVTRRVRGPAVLVEGGFVSHPQEAHLLQDPVYRQTIANSIAEGIVKFLQVARPSAAGSPPPRA